MPAHSRAILAALAACVALLVFMSSAAAVPLRNGDFETGDFSSWNVFGTSEVRGDVWTVPPTQGSYQAYLIAGTEGCYGCFSNDPHPTNADLGLVVPPSDVTIYPQFSGSAITQVFNAPPDAVLRFDMDWLANDGCAAGGESHQYDVTSAIVNGRFFNLCGLRGQAEPLTAPKDLGGKLIFGPGGRPDHYEGYAYNSGYGRFTIPLSDITPQLYPGLAEPGYLLAFFTSQGGGDFTSGTAMLVDNVRLVNGVPEPATALLLTVAAMAAWVARRSSAATRAPRCALPAGRRTCPWRASRTAPRRSRASPCRRRPRRQAR
jgi:hypothetical protein